MKFYLLRWSSHHHVARPTTATSRPIVPFHHPLYRPTWPSRKLKIFHQLIMSVFVIDNDLASSVSELASIVDQVQQSTDYSQAVRPLVDASTQEITDKSALINQIYHASSPEIIAKLNDKEFEPAFNLVVYILSELYGGLHQVLDADNDKLIQNLLACSPAQQLSLRDRKSIKATSILSELSLLFNLLPATSGFRTVVVQKIIDFVRALKLDYGYLQTFQTNLVPWLVQTGADSSTIRSIFYDFIELDSKSSLSSLKTIYNFTKQYEVSGEELERIIKFSLNSDIVDLSFMINVNMSHAITANSNSPNVKLFADYLEGKPLKSDQFNSLEFKSSMLSLCRFFKSSGKYEFGFNEMLTGTDEVLLINCIKYGLLEGKVDQVNEKFYLTRLNKFILGDQVEQDVSDVKQSLEAWKKSLIEVGSVVENFRENMQ